MAGVRLTQATSVYGMLVWTWTSAALRPGQGQAVNLLRVSAAGSSTGSAAGIPGGADKSNTRNGKI